MSTILKEFNRFDTFELGFIGVEEGRDFGGDDSFEARIVLEAIDLGFEGGNILTFIRENIEEFIDGFVIEDETVIDELDEVLILQAVSSLT